MDIDVDHAGAVRKHQGKRSPRVWKRAPEQSSGTQEILAQPGGNAGRADFPGASAAGAASMGASRWKLSVWTQLRP